MSAKDWRNFIKLESSSGIVLFLAAVLALVCDNIPLLSQYYDNLLHMTVIFKFGPMEMTKQMLTWINDGLMAIFFFLVGLEVKREIFEGELNALKKATLPGIAAIGGMLVPALLYVALNHSDPIALRGWAIPAATDIAFSLGILALLRSRIPASLKVFLTALAIFDDIGAIIIIAVFYTSQIAWGFLLIAAVLSFFLFLLNRFNVCKLIPYLIIGMFLWFCVLKSGLHATLSGIIVAFAIPIREKENPRRSPLRRLEYFLHPWVAFCILPLFAFANAGFSISALKLSDITSPITMGVAAGLFFGKQIGVWVFSWLAIKLGWAHLPQNANFKSIYGVSLIAGVGFTMSLFIGSLAFGDASHSDYPDMVRLGVIVGSLLSGILGYWVLRTSHGNIKHSA